MGLSDEETVLAITENPYLQYFIGLHEFQKKPPFDSSTITHFRKRLDAGLINDINELIVQKQQVISADKHSKDDLPNDNGGTPLEGTSDAKETKNNEKNHHGKLLLEATCAPADIAYLTDVGLMNQAREKLEGMIDTLHTPFIVKQCKPRTYREIARKQYLSLSKQRKPGMEKIRKAIKQQLSYVRRNLQHVEDLGKQCLHTLNNKQYRDLFVIQELYRQQNKMFEEESKSIDDRIVSISQPHIRPIVCGKANANVEYGAKISVSVVDGYAFLDEGFLS